MTMMMASKTTIGKLVAIDLLAEWDTAHAAGLTCQVYDILDDGGRKIGEALRIPSTSRVGVALGGPATWGDAGSVDEALERIASDTVVE